jgi:hypothetical protein
MESILKLNYEKPLLDELKKKYSSIYKMVESKSLYLDWENALFELENKGNVELQINKKDSKQNIAKLSFKIKMKYDEYKGWLPDGIVKSSLKLEFNPSLFFD